MTGLPIVARIFAELISILAIAGFVILSVLDYFVG
jgi:hypothetical protein